MAESITISRPYANAVFKIAQEKDELRSWSKLLLSLSECVADSKIGSMIMNPEVSNEQMINLFVDIIGSLSANAQNFLSLLAKNNRLCLLPEIAVSFELLREEAEKVMMVSVTSACALTSKQREIISMALKNRLDRDVILSTRVDKRLLGGAIIQAHDLVIDGSALGKLNRLANHLG